MPASEAQIRANQANSKKSKGPVTEAGKMASRGNAYKHGLTATKVLPELEAEAVGRLYQTFLKELNPSGQVGDVLVLRVATLAIRMQRCVEYETAILTDRVRQAEADFLAPEGCEPAQVDRLRVEAGKRALFDPSKPAVLARKYEAAAERGFFRALRELRQHERDLKATEDEVIDNHLASISPGDMTDAEFDAMVDAIEQPTPPKPDSRSLLADLVADQGRVDVPITVGKRR